MDPTLAPVGISVRAYGRGPVGARRAVCTLLGGLILLTAAVSDAQVLYSTVIGHVTDATGGVIASASVTARHLDTNEAFTAITNESGLFGLTLLPPGPYAVTIAKAGFDHFEANVSVGFYATARVDAVLQVAGLNVDLVVSTVTTGLQEDLTDYNSHLVVLCSCRAHQGFARCARR